MKNTKKALLSSVLALVLCFTMLLGSTFAWFTDSAISSDNKIVAGTLDVELWQHTAAGSTNITSESDPIFSGDIIWEPGKTEVVYLSIRNNGNLALKYKVAIEVTSVSDHDLTEVMYYAIAPGAVLGDVTDWVGDESADAKKVNAGVGFTETDFVDMVLEKNGDEHFFALSIHMDDEAGNHYMGDSVTFDIKVLAAQASYEEDSFGPTYDEDAKYLTSAATLTAFFNAIESGDDMLLTEPIVINEATLAYMNERYPATTFALGEGTEIIGSDAVIDGGGITVYRTEETKDKPLFLVKSGYTLTLSNITLDGGAAWTGDIHPVLLRGTENSGIVTTGTLITSEGNGNIVLNEGAILQNNDGANAVSLATRGGGVLTINGGKIINNNGGGAGAIWGGGSIVMNEGKLNGNMGGIGGVVRTVSGNANGRISFTVNGGEIKHNYATQTGGVIWSGNYLDVHFNGGEVAYNGAASAGAVIWGGSCDRYYITGDFEMHHNEGGELANAIRFNYYMYPSLEMTGGKIYANDANGLPAIWSQNNPMTLSGGTIEDNIAYTGGVGLTMGMVEMSGVISYDLSTNHNTAYLAKEFNAFKFTVNESAGNFASFNFKPAADYTYTEGDEEKLVCMNEGYETYWDEATLTFKLQAK